MKIFLFDLAAKTHEKQDKKKKNALPTATLRVSVT